MDNKIDFVIIWVDGNDPEWKKEKAKYSSNDRYDNRNIRFRDWENLKYWFRGVEKYTPWVNKIHFVTCGHLPKWLNVDNPKINIVKHSDFIPKKYLPTFSSHTIELNLYRIKGLSENFVYFNDDIFILKKLRKSYFFKNNLPCDLAVFSPATSNDELYLTVCNKNNIIINNHFNKKEILKKNLFKYLNIKYGFFNVRTLLCIPFNRILGFYESHSCNSYQKTTFKKVWAEEYEILDKTCMHKFRTQNDVNQSLIKQWEFCEGNFIPIGNKKKSLTIFKDVNYACNLIETRKYGILCLNDGVSSDEEFVNAKEKIIASFEKILPEKSSFEK